MKDAQISIISATKKDRSKLSKYFQHYKHKDIIRKRVKRCTSHNFTIIAKDKDKIIGILQWYPKEDPESGLAEFEEIHVLEEYWGRGIGGQMIRKAIGSVRNYFNKIGIKPRKIFLFVSKANKTARKLYETQGFKKVANAGDLFKNNSQQLLYVLDLQNTNKRYCYSIFLFFSTSVFN